jgi:hypothetical protein
MSVSFRTPCQYSARAWVAPWFASTAHLLEEPSHYLVCREIGKTVRARASVPTVRFPEIQDNVGSLLRDKTVDLVLEMLRRLTGM